MTERPRDDPTWRSLRRDARRALTQAGIGAADIEVRWLAAAASGREPGELELHRHDRPTRLAAATFDRLVERRCTGEPLQYVLGGWGFRALDLLVDRRVLIPRPETEIVVEHALAAVDEASARGARPVRAVDLGTGSGAIALSLVAERPDVEVWATDVDADALLVARANLGGAGRVSTRVRLVHGRWFEALDAELAGALDLVVSNPPYVADHEVLPEEVERWEPTAALRAGPTGLECVGEVVAGSVRWLRPGGALVVEIGAHQGSRARELAESAGLDDVSVATDLAGRDRVLLARRVR